MNVKSMLMSEMRKKKITFADYLLMPQVSQPYEIIDGEMIMYSAPTPAHQKIVLNLIVSINPHVTATNLGTVLCAPIDIIVQRDPVRTRQPDVLFIHRDKLPGTSLDDLEELQVLETAPDLTVEVLSPSDTKKVLSGKMQDYQHIGVKACWVVSRESRSVEVLRLTKDDSQRLGRFGIGETVRSDVLPDLQMAVDDIFV